MQLVKIVHDIYEILEESTKMWAVFLDISKAFDTVWLKLKGICWTGLLVTFLDVNK